MSNDKYRILCTRPLTDSSIAAAGANGIDIDVQEFIQIRPLLLPALYENRDTAVSSIMVFTSAKAVEILAEGYLAGWHSVAAPPAQVCCINGNTRQAVQKAFPDCTILAEASYGKDLAAAMIQLGSIHEVSFFCGNQRRDELPGILKAAGITVNEYVIYENIPTPVATNGDYDGIMFFSPSAVKSYLLANRLRSKTVCFAIGTTTADSLRDNTTGKIIMSTTTSEESMVQTAILYFNNINCNE